MNRSADSDGKPFDALLVYSFKLRGTLHDVQVEHKGGVWRILSDGEVAATKAHHKENPITPAWHTVPFFVKDETDTMATLYTQAALFASWRIRDSRWSYKLKVHGTQ